MLEKMFYSSISALSFFVFLFCLLTNASHAADWNTVQRKTPATVSSTKSDENTTTATNTNTCTLYMAPSSIPQAGYGIFTTKSFAQYSSILRQDGPNIAVIDPYRIPSSHTDKFDDVWWAEANGMSDEMKYEGEIVVDYQIMLGALPNYHPYLHNIMNVPHPNSNAYQDGWNALSGDSESGSRSNRGPGAGAFTYYKGKHFAADHDIEAGDELFLDYGTSWLESRAGDYDHVPRNGDYVKAGEILLTLLKDWNLENDMDDLFSSTLSSSVQQHESCTFNNTDKINQILTHTRRISAEIIDVPRVSSLIPENEQQLKQVLLHVYNKQAAKNTCVVNDTERQRDDCNSELPSKNMAEWATAKDLGFAIAHELTVNRRSVEWIHENGICVDNIVAGPSAIQHAGQGARAQRRIAKGEIIVPVPLLHIMDREALRTFPVIVTSKDEIDTDGNDDEKQSDDANDDGIEDKSSKIDDYNAESHDSIGDDSTIDDNDDESSTPLRQLLQRDFSKTQKQLLLNYCFGHEMSSLLLCPVTNAILINHCSDRKDSRHPCGTRGGGPNAKYQWASNPKWDTKTSNWLNKTLEEMEEAKDWRLLSMEIVATRDIEVGEEIFMDYGPNWEEAWDKHVETWEQPESGSGFEHHVSASELNQQQRPIVVSNDLINEYTFSTDVFTVCWYWEHAVESEQEYDDEDFNDGWKDLDDEDIMSRYGASGHRFIRHDSTIHYGEFWPCSVIHKNDEGNAPNSPKDDSTYTVRIYPSKTLAKMPKWHSRGLPRFLTNFPRESIQYFTKPYRSDQHLPGAFRHHIEINDDIFPEQWKNRKPGWNGVDENSTFKKDDRVLANYLGRGGWFRATIESVKSNNHYDVVYTDDSVVERDLNESFIKKSDWVTTPLRYLRSSLYL